MHLMTTLSLKNYGNFYTSLFFKCMYQLLQNSLKKKKYP